MIRVVPLVRLQTSPRAITDPVPIPDKLITYPMQHTACNSENAHAAASGAEARAQLHVVQGLLVHVDQKRHHGD